MHNTTFRSLLAAALSVQVKVWVCCSNNAAKGTRLFNALHSTEGQHGLVGKILICNL